MTNETIEKVVDVVEETVDAIERIPTAHLNGTTKKQQVIILGLTAVVSGLVGGAISHFVTKKFLTTKFDTLLASEIEAAKEFYALTNKTDEFGRPLKPEDLFSQYASDDVKKTVSEYDTRSNNIVKTDDEAKAEAQELARTLIEGMQTPNLPVITDDGQSDQPADDTELQNIFEGYEPSEDLVWDDEAEKSQRTNDKPYIISHDEFYEASPDYEQDELIYYDVDSVLADNQGIPVPDPETTVGEVHLDMFGHGSKNANTLFIRNDKLQLDMEITKANGRYSEMVLGLDGDDLDETELRHSSYRHPRKFRASDE